MPDLVPIRLKKEFGAMVSDFAHDLSTDDFKPVNPKAIHIYPLIDERRRHNIDIELEWEYTESEVKKRFSIGCGVVEAEDYRNLPATYHLQF